MVIYFVMFMVFLGFIVLCLISDEKKAKKYFAPGGVWEHNMKWRELYFKVKTLYKPEMTVDEFNAYKKVVEEFKNFGTKR